VSAIENEQGMGYRERGGGGGTIFIIGFRKGIHQEMVLTSAYALQRAWLALLQFFVP